MRKNPNLAQLVLMKVDKKVIRHLKLSPEKISEKVLELLQNGKISLDSFNGIVLEDGFAIFCTNFGDYKLRKDLLKSKGLNNFQKLTPTVFPTFPCKRKGLDDYEFYPED